MTEHTGAPEKAVGKPYGRMFTVRKSMLGALEGTLSTLADQDAMDKLPPTLFYTGMSQEKVKVQLIVFSSEV